MTDFSYEHPRIEPIRIEDDDIKHTRENNYTCLDVTCGCKTPGALARRNDEIERARGNVLKHDPNDVLTDVLPRWPSAGVWDPSIYNADTAQTGATKPRTAWWRWLRKNVLNMNTLYDLVMTGACIVFGCALVWIAFIFVVLIFAKH